MKKATTLLIITLMCTSCHIRRNVGEQGQAGYEILEYYVENGIGEDYYPSKLLICDEERWVMSTRHEGEHSSTFYTTSDGGKNWEKGYDSGGNWICDNLVIDSGTLDCSLRDEGRNGVTVKSGRIISSTDYGVTWKDLFLLDAEVRQLLVTNRIIGLQLYSASEKAGQKTYDIKYSIELSDSNNIFHSITSLDNSSPTSFSRDRIAVGLNNENMILSFNPLTERIDSIIGSFKIINQIRYGEDILGVWNRKTADYFRIIGDSAHFVSRIKFQDASSDHIPDCIHQHGDIVYTSVYVPGMQPDVRMFISTDRAKSWTQVSAKGPISNEYDQVWTPVGANRFMAGYKEQVVSYCVGERNGHRQDFIKILRPKD